MGSLKSAKQNEEKSRQQKTFTKQAEDKLKKTMAQAGVHL